MREVKLDFSYLNLYEAFQNAVATSVKAGDHPSMIRANYEALMNCIYFAPRQHEFIEEESRVYLVIWTPVGRVLAYYDPSCAQYQGFLINKSPDSEIELVLAA